MTLYSYKADGRLVGDDIPKRDAPEVDILQGAAEIARFLFGSVSDRRRVYFLVESGALPHFRLGGTICARKSKLIDWIEEQEATSYRFRAPLPMEAL